MGKKQETSPDNEEWSFEMKESWHVNFEKEAVNDERWTCVVTAAVQAEICGFCKTCQLVPGENSRDLQKAPDEECIQIFNQCAATGVRRAINTITMSDVVKLLKNVNVRKKDEKKSKKPNQSKEKLESFSDFSMDNSQILELAAKYAKFTDVECQLPPDLMAGVLKYLILQLKQENCFQKKVEAAKAKKARQEKIKADFIRDMRPYEVGKESSSSELRKIPPNPMGLQKPIDDEPYGGPDLYILISDFYDPFCFPELLRLNVPFVAILKISSIRETGKWSHTSVPGKVENANKKTSLIAHFWNTLKSCCLTLEKTVLFKDIAMLRYQVPGMKNLESKNYTSGIIFDELSWMLYSVYCIYRQHQNYLQEMFVQRLILSLEPLDLNKCKVYNKLCDALITGEPITPLLILYAMIEQVVAGVPDTESTPLEYEPKFSDFYATDSKSEELDGLVSIQERSHDNLPPCERCRQKHYTSTNTCRKWEKTLGTILSTDFSSEKEDWSDVMEERSSETDSYKTGEVSQQTLPSNNLKNITSSLIFNELHISEELISQILNDKIITQDKKWKSPSLYLYGDYVGLQTYHCDPRLLDVKSIVSRFLKNADVPKLWTKYPTLQPEDRVFYNYHFFSLWKISGESQDFLKLKVYFALSMKLITISKFYLYRGDEENLSEMFAGATREKLKKLSKVRFDQNAHSTISRNFGKMSSSYFFRNLIEDNHFRMPRKTVIKIENMDRVRNSLLKTDSHNLRKVTSQFNIYLVTHRSSGTCFPYCFRHWGSIATNSSLSVSLTDKESVTLSSLIDCFDISNLTEPHFLTDKEDYLNLIKDFNYFEKLDSERMVQRLLDAQENYNTIQCSYFAPTDTLIIVMHNDFDYRGIFYTYGFGALRTPVTFRDFHNYVYPEISDWLMDEEAEFVKYKTNLEEKIKKVEEKKDQEYLLRLKKQFARMCEKEKQIFLQSSPQLDITEEDLEDLPFKPKPYYPNKWSFVTTNFGDIRVETQRSVHEYHSKDGTEVNVIIDSWLYDPYSLLTLSIKISKLRLIYHHWLESNDSDEIFSLKTISDIIFVFYKKNDRNASDQNSDCNYTLKISWPSGLIVEPVFKQNSDFYVKQSYIKIYKKNWDIKEERCRCFLKNGQVLIFKENGSVDVLCASGTKYSLLEFISSSSDLNSVAKFELTSATGEVWAKTNVGPCRNKIKLVNFFKIYVGVDSKNEEIYYKRDDGVSCMLWSSGTLVTLFPDGTKITSKPEFDSEEISIEWSEEEKFYFLELQMKQKDSALINRTILRKTDSLKSGLSKSNANLPIFENFVSVSISYLMEHPKYSSVSYNPKNTFALLRMPDSLTLKIYPEGNYEVRQDRNVLSTENSILLFYTECKCCEEKSMVTINFEDEKNFCQFVDFFRKSFTVRKNGETFFHDYVQEDEDVSSESSEFEKSSCSFHNKSENLKTDAVKHRCFAFERDLSGYEFLHSDALAFSCYHLSLDTHYDLHVKSTSDPTITHTFSNPYYKVGYENWVMEYEERENSLPTNLKKKDLKEQGVKENLNKLFKYPFPKDQRLSDATPTCNKPVKPKMPKAVITRTVRCLSQQPRAVIDDLQKYVAMYQKKARQICKLYKNHKIVEDRSHDSRYVKMRLLKTALTLTQSLNMYPHLCSQLPSTEKDIHYSGHFINLMDEIKPLKKETNFLPDCKQIPKPLPGNKNFECIYEEGESNIFDI